MKTKIFKILYLILLYGFPLLNLVVFYSYVFKSIDKLGYLPSYNNPDPKSIISLASYRQLIYNLGDLLLISLTAIVVGLVLSFILKGNFFKSLRIHYLISFILILLNFIGPFNEWFAD